ncbi:hypothetical protein [Singulisphaera sp. PoT]|uniref:hypothetical protein n=1 Tax=Singulisphaera sp. PoT TaxID=3411797 RepID=UPI003BF5FEB6
METDLERVVVKDGMCSLCELPTKRVHHRHFPEIWAECYSEAAGIAQLSELLSRYRDGAQSDWHRDAIDLAIADVAAYREALDREVEVHVKACRCHPRGDIASDPEPSEYQGVR